MGFEIISSIKRAKKLEKNLFSFHDYGGAVGEDFGNP